ncbi:hypothetical protein CN135_32570 [Sinorhizobium meliloti]|uniref:hypothetical protein n=1 Tax=Rhizobium meliloti TaxID=382 RepID=UPI000FD92AE1|nr:hypothetical protein [Sinorhizobium meliloti]RVI69728.1 hypothetical protein CN189_01860 [Sinorhizobium meliloti]RVL70062.1 hypothetical protein CN135_32570 [Sinorhizobium meliloti]
MDTKLADLKLRPWLLRELNLTGYEVVGDLQHLPTAELLRIPGMGGHDWRKIAKALGRDPFPGLKKRR